MSIYFVQAGPDGPVKIGYSKSHPERMNQIQVECPWLLVLINLLDGSRPEEKSAHFQFAEHRISGEWFAFHPDMLRKDLDLTILPPKPEKAPEPPKKDTWWERNIGEPISREELVAWNRARNAKLF